MPEPAEKQPRTNFAPPERDGYGVIRTQNERLRKEPLIAALLAAFPEPAMILNGKRQIVLANERLCLLMDRPVETVLGLRPGEALDCIHSADTPDGCGTSSFCRYCGAANAILDCLEEGKSQVEECRINRVSSGSTTALDLRVWATPLELCGGEYVVFAVKDTTDEKRRQALERIFFHDVLNVAGGLQGLTDLMADSDAEETDQLRREVHSLARQLIDEIKAQKDLSAAERGDLQAECQDVDAGDLLGRLCAFYAHHWVADGKRLVTTEISGSTMLRTDGTLLGRVIGNLIKNALEASTSGQVVEVGFRNNGRPTFTIWNERAMPEDVRAQMFQRSFSTKKGSGRGLGSYSVKLLTERYLDGTVTFTSQEGEGTRFTVTLPRTD